MAKRGEYTAEIEQKMKKFLGRESSQTELRLYPYIVYVMTNERSIDPNKINQHERVILSLLREAGHIEGGASGMAVTKEFWDFANDVIFDAYVAYDN